MFKATAKLYDATRRVTAAHTALGGTIMLASQAALGKLLDDVSPGQLRLIEWDRIEVVVTRVQE
jgi:hypothetical protein